MLSFFLKNEEFEKKPISICRDEEVGKSLASGRPFGLENERE